MACRTEGKTKKCKANCGRREKNAPTIVTHRNLFISLFIEMEYVLHISHLHNFWSYGINVIIMHNMQMILLRYLAVLLTIPLSNTWLIIRLRLFYSMHYILTGCLANLCSPSNINSSLSSFYPHHEIFMNSSSHELSNAST